MDASITTVILNLPEKTERRRSMETLMNAIGIKHYTFRTPVRIPEDAVGPHLNAAQRSLNETNLQIMRETMQSAQTPYLLILEDDLVTHVPPETLLSTLYTLIRALPEHWTMLYLEYCFDQCWHHRPIVPGLVKAFAPLCTAAILYRTSHLSIPYTRLKSERMHKVIDHAYRSAIRSGEIQAFAASPPLFYQDVQHHPSDIRSFYFKRAVYGYSPCMTKMWWTNAFLIGVLVWVLFFFLWNRGKNKNRSLRGH